MLSLAVLNAEKQYIKSGIIDNIRNDGRKRLDYRNMILETSILPQTNGSARLRIGVDDTDVIVGIKAEIGEPKLHHPNNGYAVVTVDCSSSIPLSIDRHSLDSTKVLITAALERVIGDTTASGINWQSLGIVPGRQCWILFIDCVIFECNGCIVDALSIAIRAALSTLRIPHITVLSGEGAGEFELEVDDDLAACTPLDIQIPNPSQDNYSNIPSNIHQTSLPRLGGGNIPVIVTVAKLNHCLIIDPTLQELACCQTSLTVAVNKTGNVCGIVCLGGGGGGGRRGGGDGGGSGGGNDDDDDGETRDVAMDTDNSNSNNNNNNSNNNNSNMNRSSSHVNNPSSDDALHLPPLAPPSIHQIDDFGYDPDDMFEIIDVACQTAQYLLASVDDALEAERRGVVKGVVGGEGNLMGIQKLKHGFFAR